MNGTSNKKIRVISWDFDGVFVLDSDGVFKPQAWSIAFQAYTGYEPHLLEAKQLFGFGKRGGRVETIRHTLEKLGVPRRDLKSRVAEVAQRFDAHVQSEILKAGLVPGARETLEDLSKSNISLYLNSGTATFALVLSAKNLGIYHFFKEILGSTPEPIGGSKVENLLHIERNEQVARESMLVVGDGESDLRAAEQFGCRFIGIANKWNGWAEKPVAFPLVVDLRDISTYV